LQEISEYNVRHKIIAGDLNLPNINWSNYTLEIGGDWHIHDITRLRGTERGNVLNLVFTDDDCVIKDIEIDSPLGRSDHTCIKFSYDIEPQERKLKRKVYLFEGKIIDRLDGLLGCDRHK